MYSCVQRTAPKATPRSSVLNIQVADFPAKTQNEIVCIGWYSQFYMCRNAQLTGLPTPEGVLMQSNKANFNWHCLLSRSDRRACDAPTVT